jgi:hypothetical protein
VLLGITFGSRISFAYRGVTFYADPFQKSSATHAISYSLPDQQLRRNGPATPITQRLLAMTRARFGLIPFRSPLLRESRLLSLPVGTEMFHFPTFPPPALCVQAGAMGHYAQQVSLFGNPRIEVWLPTPRGLSQAPTSFFGSWCQGIHRVPLLAWQLQMMLASTVQFSRYGRSRPRAASWRAGTGPRRGSAQNAAVPSGPNSVLGPGISRISVPCRRTARRQHGDRTNRPGDHTRSE